MPGHVGAQVGRDALVGPRRASDDFVSPRCEFLRIMLGLHAQWEGMMAPARRNCPAWPLGGPSAARLAAIRVDDEGECARVCHQVHTFAGGLLWPCALFHNWLFRTSRTACRSPARSGVHQHVHALKDLPIKVAWTQRSLRGAAWSSGRKRAVSACRCARSSRTRRAPGESTVAVSCHQVSARASCTLHAAHARCVCSAGRF